MGGQGHCGRQLAESKELVSSQQDSRSAPDGPRSSFGLKKILSSKLAIAAFVHRRAPNRRGMRPGFGSELSACPSPLRPPGAEGVKGHRLGSDRPASSFLWDLAPPCGRRLRSQRKLSFFFYTGYLKRVIVTPTVSKPGFGSEPVRVSFSPPCPPRGGGVERPRARFRPPGRNDGSNYDSVQVAGEQKAQVISFRRRDTSFCPPDGAKPPITLFIVVLSPSGGRTLLSRRLKEIN